jgi:hypothetical protein
MSLYLGEIGLFLFAYGEFYFEWTFEPVAYLSSP